MIGILQLLRLLPIPGGLSPISLGRIAFLEPCPPKVFEFVAFAEVDDCFCTKLLDHNINALSTVFQVVSRMLYPVFAKFVSIHNPCIFLKAFALCFVCGSRTR